MSTKIIIIILAVIIGLAVFLFQKENLAPKEESSRRNENIDGVNNNRFEFSELSDKYRFSSELPDNLKSEYIRAVEAINISSQIFIRYFEANEFLTLSTVNILSRQETTVNGHQAVKYEIEKKAGVPDFPNQPSWRNQRHKLIDIRLTRNNPSIFYVIAYNSQFSEKEFNNFIESLVFHNDNDSFVEPLDKSEDRITKKPFGIFVEPDDSSVQPEKFTGYHTGIDFEAFEKELNIDVKVRAVCGGFLKSKAQTQGYGGYAVQECLLEDEKITVVYGHLRLNSIKTVGEYLVPGKEIGLLGTGFSPETDNERKHLHLSIVKGVSSDIRGYIQNQTELSKWLNPEEVLDLK